MRAASCSVLAVVVGLALTASCGGTRKVTVTAPPRVFVPPPPKEVVIPEFPPPPPLSPADVLVADVPTISRPPALLPPPPARRARRRIPAVKPAPEQGSLPETEDVELEVFELTEVLPAQLQKELESAIDQQLAMAEARLAAVSGKLRADRRGQAERVRTLIRQAREARKTDLAGAKKLAERANLVAQTLVAR